MNRNTLVWPAMLAILAAGLAKIIDPASFFVALKTWKAVPNDLGPLIVSLVPLCELVVSFAWMLGIARRAMTIAAYVGLLLLTILYTYQLVRYGAPDCGCMGRAMKWFDHPAIVLSRNALILIGLLSPAWLRLR